MEARGSTQKDAGVADGATNGSGGSRRRRHQRPFPASSFKQAAELGEEGCLQESHRHSPSERPLLAVQ